MGDDERGEGVYGSCRPGTGLTLAKFGDAVSIREAFSQLLEPVFRRRGARETGGVP